MTQPSALDAGIKQSSLLFPARSSPVICFVDSIITLIDFSYRVYHGCSVRQAAWQVRWRILQERFGEETTLENDSIQRNPFTSVILFIGTVVQAVKIFGYEGITWPKIIAAIYLGSYIISAAISLAASPQEDHIPSRGGISYPSVQHWDRFMPKRTLIETIVAGSGHIILCCFAFYHMLHQEQPASGEGNVVLVQVVTLIYAVPIVAVVVIIPFKMWPTAKALSREIREAAAEPVLRMKISGLSTCALKIVALLGCAQIVILWITNWDFIAPFLIVLINWLTEGGVFLILAEVLLLVSLWGWELWFSRKLSIEERGRLFFMFFAVFNLLVAGLYCWVAYDSWDTVKPAWTEMLG